MYKETVWYCARAVDNYLRYLHKLKDVNSQSVKRDIEEEIEKLEDIRKTLKWALEQFSEICDDVDPRFPDKIYEYLARIVFWQINDWEKERERLGKKDYQTRENENKISDLDSNIRDFKIPFMQGRFFYKYKDCEPIEIPGEKIAKMMASSNFIPDGFFPFELINCLPKQLQKLCDDFNYNYSAERANTCTLILRRILPYSIIKKCKSLSKEDEIKNEQGDYIETKQLLGKVRLELRNPSLYNRVDASKVLLDGSQHYFDLNYVMSDVEKAGMVLRLFLEDMFGEETE